MPRSDRKWEQAKDEAAAAAEHTKQAAAMKWDETKDNAWQMKEDLKQEANLAAQDAKFTARDVSNAASDKWEETKCKADFKSKQLAEDAIIKGRQMTDATDSRIQSGLDRCEERVEDPRSFVDQATAQASHLASAAVDGAMYAASALGAGLTVAAEGAAHLATSAYETVASAVDSVVHPAPIVPEPEFLPQDGKYYKKEEITITKPLPPKQASRL